VGSGHGGGGETHGAGWRLMPEEERAQTMKSARRWGRNGGGESD
jgi:hypothetical protein